jgi:RNA polymerase sigma-70 factor, ECF subfamily
MQTKSSWVREIREGNEDAFRQLFDRYCRPLLRFTGRYVRDAAVAEDIVQDVFLAVWGNRTQLDPSLNIKTYLYTAARNQALKRLRHTEVERRNTEQAGSRTPSPSTPEDERREREVADAVHLAIECLPEKCRLIFCMSRYDHLTYAEISKIQDISIKTVETQMGRALRFLRDRLAPLR